MAFKRPRAAFEADLQAQQSPYVLYGTPLPPLDPEVRDDGSYVPVWKQEVRDDRGRKRLHGAFTGGFSAGYFNTVGSKEGWTPSTFVSSRTKRNDGSKAAQRRPEDLMDEEDLADMAEAQQLQTTQSFAGLGASEEDPVRRGLLTDLARAQGDTMGVKLLQRMGWRRGQGVGARVRRKARVDADGDEELAAGTSDMHLFAPENSRMISFVKKNDYKGLGYGGEARLSRASEAHDRTADHDEDDGEVGAVSLGPRRKKSMKTNRKSGFGVGILNDTGSDEEDPYEIGPRLSYNKTIGQEKKVVKKPSSKAANPLLVAKPKFVSKKNAVRNSGTADRKCHDGRPPLPGFVLYAEAARGTKGPFYPPPQIPEGWKSAKELHLNTPSQQTYQSSADAARSSALDPKSRAALLGEAALPGKSVFDYLSPAARSRLSTASGRTDLPAAGNEAPPPGHGATKTDADRQRDLLALVPPLDAGVAAATLGRSSAGGWMPYADDEAKRARYRGFLELRAGRRSGLPDRPADMAVQEWVQEMEEFARAAMVFRPVSGMMASRFTAASSSSRLEASEGAAAGDDTASLLSTPATKKVEDPAETAARMGMYGPMTRTVDRFFPTRLTCKRFGIPPPEIVDPSTEPGGESATSARSLEVVSKSAMDEMMREVVMRPMEHVATDQGAPVPTPSQPAAPAEVDMEKNEALEAERPGEAVFKAIFGSDDDDDDE